MKKKGNIMKAIWDGSLSFGLVTIPVRLYSATEAHSLGFKVLCAKCHNPLSYLRYCSKCKKEVAWEDVTKGLKQENGKYFITTPEKIKELKPEKTDSISIIEFVDKDEIDFIYLSSHYYLAPKKKSENAYFLFRKALEDTNKVGIGTFVMRDKEYVCALTPYETGLLLTTMNYTYEIRPIKKIGALKDVPKIKASELKLAKQLIGQLSKKRFDLSKFKDTFAQKLKAAIKKGKKVRPKKGTQKKKPTKAAPSGKKKQEETILTSLRASLEKPKRPRPIAQAKKGDL